MDNQDPYNDAPPAQDSPADQSPKPKEESDTGQEELLSTAFFQGKDLEVGSKCEVEITGIHDGEVSVKYVAHDEEENKDQSPEPGEEVAAPKGDGEYSSMME
jgi:hypothetical protein